jgi:pilus assembly protein CpaF
MWSQATETVTEDRPARFRDELHRTVVEALDLSRLDRWPVERTRSEVQTLAKSLAPRVDRKLGTAEVQRVANEVMDEVFGLGPLEPLIRDGSITEILVNGPRSVYVERDGQLQPTDVRFTDDGHLVRLVQRIAARVGRRIDESAPLVDARLPDGSRVHAVLPPLTLNGPVLSIRRFGTGLTAEGLQALGAMPGDVLQFLQAAVASRVNLLISGGAGAGKTTLLNALSASIPADERIVTIEDAAELRLQQPHVIRMETRVPNLEGKGLISQRELLRNSLRMRPDRIIVGECRGAETVDMLQAMNSGHEGSMTTLHANDTRDALARLELLLGVAGFEVPVPVMRGYIAAALPLLVQVSRLKGGARKLTRVSEVLGVSKRQQYKVRDLFVFKQERIDAGHAVGTFHTTGYTPKLHAKLLAAGYGLGDGFFAERAIP